MGGRRTESKGRKPDSKGHRVRTVGSGGRRGRLRAITPDGEPAFVRLHHLVGDGDPTPASAVAGHLIAAHRAAKGYPDLALLAGGLGRVAADAVDGDGAYSAYLRVAGDWLAELEDTLGGRLDRPALIGFDVLMQRPGRKTRRSLQLIAHHDPQHGHARIVGAKGYPTPKELPHLFTHHTGLPRVVHLPKLGRVLPLVCHDLNAFNSRGRATTRTRARNDLRRRMERTVKESQWDVLFDAIHQLPSHRTFVTSFNEVERRYKGARIVGAFGWEDGADVTQAVPVARQLTRGGLTGVEVVPW